jgi:hypothetical protein
MSKNRGADRPRDKSDSVDGEGFQCSNPRVGMREKQLGEDEARDRAVEEKIVTFDRVPGNEAMALPPDQRAPFQAREFAGPPAILLQKANPSFNASRPFHAQ